MLTRFPNWTTVTWDIWGKGQSVCPVATGVDMCSQAYPPVVNHIHIPKNIFTIVVKVENVRPGKVNALDNQKLLPNEKCIKFIIIKKSIGYDQLT